MALDVGAALAIIEPAPCDRERCALALARFVDIVRETSNEPTAGEHRDAINALADQLARLKIAVNELSPSLANVVFGYGAGAPVGRRAFLDDVERLRQSAIINSKISGPKTRQIELRKVVAASLALGLLEEFSQHRPSRHRDGAYFALAAELYGGATGQRSAAGVDRACLRVMDDRAMRDATNAENLGRHRS